MKKSNKVECMQEQLLTTLDNLIHAAEKMKEHVRELKVKMETTSLAQSIPLDKEERSRSLANFKSNKWTTNSISPEAYSVIFGVKDIPKDSSGGKMVSPGVVQLSTSAGMWVGTVPSEKGECQRWMNLRFSLDGCNPEYYKLMTTHPFFRECETNAGLNTSILRTWYFIRLKDSYRVARSFLQRRDLDKFGLKCMRGSRKKLYVVKDLGAFRTGLYQEYGIQSLPGDRSWIKNELKAAGTKKVEVKA